MSTRNSCIEHPAGASLVIIREEYLALCDGDHCAAALLAVFEFWHNVKLANAEQADIDQRISKAEGVAPQQSSELWVYKTYADLKADLLGLFGETKIAAGVKFLIANGYLNARSNPNYQWDKTPQYLFVPSQVQSAMPQNSDHRRRKNTSSMAQKYAHQSRKKTPAIPETTTETTPETKEQQRPAREIAPTPVELTVRNEVAPTNLTNAFAIYERNIGVMTPLLADAIRDALKHAPTGWVEDAIKEAALNGAHSWNYVSAILKRWEKEGRLSARPAAANGNGKHAPPTPAVKEFRPSQDYSEGVPVRTSSPEKGESRAKTAH